MGRKSDALVMGLMGDIEPAPADTGEFKDFPDAEGGDAGDAGIYSQPFFGEGAEPLNEAHAYVEAEAASARVHNDAIDMGVARSAARRAPFPNSAAEAARLSVVRDYHQQISPNDSLYFVMTFVERAAQQIAADVGERVRMQGIEVVNSINDATSASVANINAAKGEMMGVQQGFERTAQVLGGKLRATGEHVLKELTKDRDVVVPILKQQLVDDLTGDEGELEQVKRRMRKELPEEVRLAIKTAVATEVTLLQGAMLEATSALKNSAAASKARAKNGWLKNIADDVKSLADEGRYVSLGAAGAVVLFGGYLLTRIVTGILG